MANVKYNGPEGQRNPEISGEPLEPGKVYSLSAAIAKKVLNSNQHFESVASKSKPKQTEDN